MLVKSRQLVSVFKSFPINNLSKPKEEETVKKLGNKRRGALVTGTEGSIFLTNKKKTEVLFTMVDERRRENALRIFLLSLSINTLSKKNTSYIFTIENIECMRDNLFLNGPF